MFEEKLEELVTDNDKAKQFRLELLRTTKEPEGRCSRIFVVVLRESCSWYQSGVDIVSSDVLVSQHNNLMSCFCWDDDKTLVFFEYFNFRLRIFFTNLYNLLLQWTSL